MVKKGVKGELVMRLFLAINLSDPVKKEIIQIKRMLENGIRGVKWVEDNNLHLTMKFLGEVEEDKLEEIKAAIARAVKDVESFKLGARTTGFFPERGTPRVVWIGINGEEEKAISLGQALDRELIVLGFEPEKRRKIHLTIGRIRSAEGGDQVIRSLEQIKDWPGTELFTVSELVLYQSTLTNRGPIYKVIEKYGFKC